MTHWFTLYVIGVVVWFVFTNSYWYVKKDKTNVLKGLKFAILWPLGLSGVALGVAVLCGEWVKPKYKSAVGRVNERASAFLDRMFRRVFG